ncbi:MAG: hypothetical protein NTW59_01060 [Candidatus Diapherotrites archaeon]|nr:hypothetical protein [Candidatus Diapherotrites archaeon]
MRSGGQLSLEFLLLLAAVFAVVAVLLPTVQRVHSDALLALDRENAAVFAGRLQHAVDEARFLADGSIASVEAQPFGKWTVRAEGENFFVALENGAGGEKTLGVLLPNSVDFPKIVFSGRKVFVVEKKAGLVYLYTAS